MVAHEATESILNAHYISSSTASIVVCSVAFIPD
jgi:hypothetical protein